MRKNQTLFMLALSMTLFIYTSHSKAKTEWVNINGTDASDFELVDHLSPAVDTGADIAGNTLDFFNRTRHTDRAPDIGALEFGSTQEECIPRFPGP